MTAGLIDLDRGVENACADAAGGVLSVMGNRDAGGGGKRGWRVQGGRDRGGQKIRVHHVLGLIREMKAVS